MYHKEHRPPVNKDHFLDSSLFYAICKFSIKHIFYVKQKIVLSSKTELSKLHKLRIGLDLRKKFMKALNLEIKE